MIKVSKEDLDYYNVTSLPLADGSGFASEIFMTHEIHCLVSARVKDTSRIRRTLTGATEEDPAVDLQGTLFPTRARSCTE